MTEKFANWTLYDEWLVENYEKYAVYKVEEKDGVIVIEYCGKEEFEQN